jgi:hypothetical protein
MEKVVIIKSAYDSHRKALQSYLDKGYKVKEMCAGGYGRVVVILEK